MIMAIKHQDKDHIRLSQVINEDDLGTKIYSN